MRYRWVGLLLLFCFHAKNLVAEELPASLISEENLTLETDHAVGADPFQERFQRMLITLFGLVAFMILGAIVVKQWMKMQSSQVNQGSAIQLLESRALSQKVSLHLVEMEGSRVLVGEMNSHLALLLLPSKSVPKGENR